MSAPIVVTGAAGFIGWRVTRTLYERGDEVVGDRPRSGQGRHVAPPRRSARGRRPRFGPGSAGSWPARAPSSTSPASTGSASRRLSDRRCTRRTSRRDRTGPRRRDRRGSPTDRLPLDRQRLRRHQGSLADETFRRDPTDGFVSYYDETKYLAHLAAEKRIAAGRARSSIVLPGTIYGPRRPLGRRGAAQGRLRRHGALYRTGRPRHLADARRRPRHGHRGRAGSRTTRPGVRHVRHEHAPARGDGDRGRGRRSSPPAARDPERACSNSGRASSRPAGGLLGAAPEPA